MKPPATSWRALPNWKKARTYPYLPDHARSRSGTPPRPDRRGRDRARRWSATASSTCPANVIADIKIISRALGASSCCARTRRCCLRSDDPLLITEIARNKHIAPLSSGRLDEHTLLGRPGGARAYQAGAGPVRLPGGRPGRLCHGRRRLTLALRDETLSGRAVRAARLPAGARWTPSGPGASSSGGSGVVVLPCGAGKTVVGMGAMDKVQAHTLILTPHTIAVRQWISEILDKTT